MDEMKKFATAEIKGRSSLDCFISIELCSQDGISVEMVSKVKALYGKQIEVEIKEMLNFLIFDMPKLLSKTVEPYLW